MEKKEASRQGKSINETIKSMGKWLYRYGVVFSVAMVVTSLLNNLGTQLVNKLGMGKERVSASVEVSGKQVENDADVEIEEEVLEEGFDDEVVEWSRLKIFDVKSYNVEEDVEPAASALQNGLRA